MWGSGSARAQNGLTLPCSLATPHPPRFARRPLPAARGEANFSDMEVRDFAKYSSRSVL